MSFPRLAGASRGGAGAAGRDITGQMFLPWPQRPERSRAHGNIAANNANPMALMQTRHSPEVPRHPRPARDLTGAAAAVSDAAAQRVGSVVGRGFIPGRSGRGALVAGPGQARYVEPRNALGHTLRQAPACRRRQLVGGYGRARHWRRSSVSRRRADHDAGIRRGRPVASAERTDASKTGDNGSGGRQRGSSAAGDDPAPAGQLWPRDGGRRSLPQSWRDDAGVLGSAASPA